MKRRNLILVIPLVLALTGISLIVVGSIPAESHEPETLYVGPNSEYKTIQSAVDDAKSGDTIVVGNGTYRENVIVEKDDLSIVSNGSATIKAVEKRPAVNARGDNFDLKGFDIIGTGFGDVVYVRSNYTDISSVNITGSGEGDLDAGVNIKGMRVYLTYVNVSNCSIGYLIETTGIRDAIYGIVGSFIYSVGSDWGGHVNYCSASNNSRIGFYLRDPVNLSLCRSISKGNSFGFLCENGRRLCFSELTAQQNKQSGFVIKESKEMQLLWISSINNGMDGLKIESSSWFEQNFGIFNENREDGISYSGICYNYFLSSNNISRNGKNGIQCDYRGRGRTEDDRCQINDNYFDDNNGYGILIKNSSSLEIYRNNFTGNNGGKDQAWCEDSTEWDGVFINITINFTNHNIIYENQGNYWSNWDTDQDKDGKIDPYPIPGPSGSEDRYPLSEKNYQEGGSFNSSLFKEFLLYSCFIMPMVGGFPSVFDEEEPASFDEFSLFKGEVFIGTGEDMKYESRDGKLVVGNLFTDEWEDPKVKPDKVSDDGIILLGLGIALLILSIISASSSLVIFRVTDRRDRQYEMMSFVADGKEAGSDPYSGLREVMEGAVENRHLRDRKRESLERDLNKRFNSGGIDRNTYDEMKSILDRKG